MTIAVTALLGGIACGSATGGWVVEHASAAVGYAVTAAVAAVTLMMSLTGPVLRRACPAGLPFPIAVPLPDRDTRIGSR
ncbi:hypothetical protein [Streptomyces himalayensis]|uniref:Uncharacterized protein n=1 Tax=Streptomyces himalayensis subsp. himalayensis TaxID=2756131 RepID=A0A7W0I7C2_9ACTN|nr:hypothetical protein [Streptomyces himalayensis]MBA2944856.1 hypothetical protein [Streptomyces himalayensis subsp. himalayensis]